MYIKHTFIKYRVILVKRKNVNATRFQKSVDINK